MIDSISVGGSTLVEHDELQTDFLNYVEVVGNIWDNKIEELVAQHSI